MCGSQYCPWASLGKEASHQGDTYVLQLKIGPTVFSGRIFAIWGRVLKENYQRHNGPKALSTFNIDSFNIFCSKQMLQQALELR